MISKIPEVERLQGAEASEPAGEAAGTSVAKRVIAAAGWYGIEVSALLGLRSAHCWAVYMMHVMRHRESADPQMGPILSFLQRNQELAGRAAGGGRT